MGYCPSNRGDPGRSTSGFAFRRSLLVDGQSAEALQPATERDHRMSAGTGDNNARIGASRASVGRVAGSLHLVATGRNISAVLGRSPFPRAIFASSRRRREREVLGREGRWRKTEPLHVLLIIEVPPKPSIPPRHVPVQIARELSVAPRRIVGKKLSGAPCPYLANTPRPKVAAVHTNGEDRVVDHYARQPRPGPDHDPEGRVLPEEPDGEDTRANSGNSCSERLCQVGIDVEGGSPATSGTS